MASRRTANYIYELPYIERMELCQALNEDDKWEELADVHIKYSYQEIQNFKKHKNPADELLRRWGHLNHTIVELFCLLARMNYPKAMIPLKNFVDEEYQQYIDLLNVNIKKSCEKEKNIKKKIDNLHFNNNESITKKINNCSKEISNSSNNASDLVSILHSSLPVLSYEDLTAATDNWSEKNLLGKGGYGTVYKGSWGDTQIAVKKYQCTRSVNDESAVQQRLDQAIREIKILQSLQHINILSLYAYNLEDIPCLVYQLISKGTLRDGLDRKFKTPPLTWKDRQIIANGIARGLVWLHNVKKKPWIHSDIKSTNILLCHDMEPKIGDFGLAREGFYEKPIKVDVIQGTYHYLPDDFRRNKLLTPKVDVYSYGIVLFELATGLYACLNKEPKEQKNTKRNKPKHKSLREHVEEYYRDQKILLLKDTQAGKENDEIYNFIIELGIQCSSAIAVDRPTMLMVLKLFPAKSDS